VSERVLPASAAQLSAAAHALCERQDEVLAGRWARAAAVLGRQALEQALDDYWTVRAGGVEQVQSMRAKLLCLPTYMSETDEARNVYHAWAELSRGCHITGYDLSPTREELEDWLRAVDALIHKVDQVGATGN
jgi:hypothetical protein